MFVSVLIARISHIGERRVAKKALKEERVVDRTFGACIRSFWMHPGYFRQFGLAREKDAVPGQVNCLTH